MNGLFYLSAFTTLFVVFGLFAMSVNESSVVPAWYLFAHLPPPLLYLCLSLTYDYVSITKKMGRIFLFLLHDMFLIGCTLLVNAEQLFIGLTLLYYSLYFTMCTLCVMEVEYVKTEYIIRQTPPRIPYVDKDNNNKSC